MSPAPRITVIIPTHNPDPVRLRRTLAGLCAQTLAVAEWETLLINNASTKFPAADFFATSAPLKFTIVAEPTLGLTAARLRGFANTRADLAVLVDDDNVLAPDYLARVLAHFAEHPQLGTAGGKSLPEFAGPPPAWTHEFFPLLALRDLGARPIIAASIRPTGSALNIYPACAPIGAGLALRRAAWTAWVEARLQNASLSDRRGSDLTSGGDNDIVLCALQSGWACGYFPDLSLTHIIPASRLTPDYLARLNRGIQQSWMQVLSLHDANPWPPLSALGSRLRQIKAAFVHLPWLSATRRIRWAGVCGHFAGRIAR